MSSGSSGGRLVVVGASLAGLRAVEAARRDGFTGEIVLVGDEPHLPYDRPPLSKAFLEDDSAPEPTYQPPSHFADLDVDLRLGTRATALDPVARLVATAGGEIRYDQLVIATGSTARTLPGLEGLPGVHVLRTLDDARGLRQALDLAGRVVVVGAGFIGSEVASSARKRGLSVTVLEAAQVPLERALGPEMGGAVSALHAANGTDLRCGVGVQGIHQGSTGLRVEATDGSSFDADLVVVGVGADPATEWLEGSGLELKDGIVCDATLSAGFPGVYAAGDVARWFNRDFDVEMRLEHWTSAAEQGAIAARNAVTGACGEYRTVPYFWSDWYDRRIQFVGVPTADHVTVVTGDPAEGRFVALFRSGSRLAGALCVGYPAHTMKYRRLIGAAASWEDGLAFADSRR
ncbi:NAD(P)/FAD-dependent oxidoreductase [Nocardioides limicola]|uniref:NAD(P)/FAD-dependent oxidoreductase n=1 Tax=Nocardioides limicola TaxID=2803368 RepID=UPI00193B298B|nr:FAD-dependent oxidoreductase [Nocardioides sp. DJM-14]